MLRRLIVSVIFWMPLMYIMCWMLWDWPLAGLFWPKTICPDDV